MKNRLVLIKPSIEYKKQITEMLDEWVLYNNTHETNKSPMAIFRDYSNFDEYVSSFETDINNPKPGFVPASTYFALDVERNVIVGAVNIRHYLNDYLLSGGGHIGDGIRPSERRKGYATEMIGLALLKCKELGIDRVLMSCSQDNIGSKKTILSNGGVFYGTYLEEGIINEKFWIDISAK